jgi:hypothetical protein
MHAKLKQNKHNKTLQGLVNSYSLIEYIFLSRQQKKAYGNTKPEKVSNKKRAL